MHENWETSESSRPNQSRDRAEKALRRTADRHVSEKSDCATVPVNLSNKEEQSSAEMGEGRARTKGNIGPSRTRQTHGRKPTCSQVGGNGADRLNTITEFFATLGSCEWRGCAWISR